MNAETPLKIASIHANTTGTFAGAGASDAFVAVSTMLPTNWNIETRDTKIVMSETSVSNYDELISARSTDATLSSYSA